MQARVGALSLGNRSLSVVYALPLPCPGVPSQNAQDAQAQVAQVSDVPGASDAYVHDLGIGTAGHVKQVTLLDQACSMLMRSWERVSCPRQSAFM